MKIGEEAVLIRPLTITKRVPNADGSKTTFLFDPGLICSILDVRLVKAIGTRGKPVLPSYHGDYRGWAGMYRKKKIAYRVDLPSLGKRWILGNWLTPIAKAVEGALAE